MRLPELLGCFLFLTLTSWAASPRLAPSIDFGWLKATQTDQGWLLTYVYQPLSTGNAIHSGDVLVSVDQQRLDDLDPLGAAHVMKAIVSARSAIVYRDNSTVRLNFASLDERVNPLPRYREEWSAPIHARHKRAPLSLVLPDVNGAAQMLSFRGKWTLLHMWGPCLDDGDAVDALNEMANPEPADLHIVGIERGDRIPVVRAHMTSRKLSFFTLVAEDLDAFSQIYDPSIEDILIDPEGRIVFMGAGDSLRNAYLLYRSQSVEQSSQR